MEDDMTRYLAAGVGLAVGVVLGVGGSHFAVGHRAPVLATAYQAVFTSTGLLLYGRLQDAGGQFPVLREVHTVQTTTNPDTKQVSSALVRRSLSLHQPDAMILNASQIVAIEPVKADSQVAKIMDEDAASH
jgi:hypothetical protein